MYIFEAFVGLPGCLNDIAILARTDKNKKYMFSSAIEHEFFLKEQKFTGAYFLADGIYPKSAFLMKTIPEPVTRKQRFFAKKQEGVRKDVERAFGRLHSKWHIVKNPGRCHKLKYLKIIWLCCIILHNMTIRDQQSAALRNTEGHESEDEESDERVEPMRDEAYYAEHSYEGIMAKRQHMENRGMSVLMQRKLMDHVWDHFNMAGDGGEAYEQDDGTVR